MNKIHSLSKITTLADFDFFTVPPTQMTIEKNIVTEHRPTSVLNPTSQIEFLVTSALDEYIQLRETMLYMKLRVNIKKAAGGIVTAAEWAKIQPVNNLLHSLWKSVDLEIENKSITQSPQTYGYKAYFETLFGYTEEAKAGFLRAGMWSSDEGKKESVQPEYASKITPSTVASDGTGKYIELMGKLHLDLAMQPRALPGGMKLKFTFIPNSKEFYLYQSDSTITTTVEFDKAALYITRSKVAFPVVEAHNLALTRGTAKYPIMRSNVKSFTIVANQQSITIDNAVTGQIPRRMFLAMVDSRGFNGNAEYNPYYFKNFDINHVTAHVDGIQYPSIAYTPDFSENQYIKEYLGLYDTLNDLHTAPTLFLTKGEFKDDTCIFGFSFSHDPTDDCNKVGYLNPIRHGAITINMRFKTPLNDNINVLLYCEYDNLVEIDATRQAICDYI